MPPKPASTNSGIRQNSAGDSIIPSSTRADGSVRKEIKVKPGYKPPEDVEVYKNRAAEAWKNRGKGGVPGAAQADDEKEGAKGGALSAAAAKNAKRREARKKAAATAGGENVQDESAEVKNNGEGDGKDDVKVEEPVDPEVEKAKEARKLTKKLRQARELQEKKEKGGDLLPEQFAKVIKMNELIRQLDSLGFDAEGEKKVGVDSNKDDD